MRRLLLIVALTLAAGVAAFFLTHTDCLLRIASGATSQNICSKTFVSGQAPDDVYAQDMRPEGGMGLIDWALHYDVDRNAKEVRTTIFGMFASRSINREDLGCVLVHDRAPVDGGVPPSLIDGPAPPPGTIGPGLESAINPALTAAIARAFEEPATGPKRWTQAVVVVHDGKVVGERYAAGIDADTPLLSHSIAKSVISALIGVLAREGKVTAASISPVGHWQADGDAGDAISVDQLLRMSSGLPLDEGEGPGLAQRMWFVEPDSAKFALSVPPSAAPDSRWGYSNLGYAILSRMAADAVGGGPRAFTQFARSELFLPLGMRHALIEYDSAGTPMGANAMFATAREWAQFGLLYLNDGVAGGKRILPEGWVKYSTTPTLGMGYGAGFWLNTTDAPMPVWGGPPWGMPGVPRDAYFARGYLGQYVVIVPSEKLVVVRFGVSHIPGGDIKGVGALVHDIIAALHQG